MRVTAVQMEIEDGAPDRNLARALGALQSSAPSDVYLLPELFTTGYAYDSWDAAADQHTPQAVRRLQSFCADRDCSVLAGMISRHPDGRLVNRLWWLDADTTAHYDKAHLIAAFREPELLLRGESPLIVDSAGACLHASVCFDLRYPEFYRAAALDGAEAFLIISEWPAVRMQALRTLALARAIENQAWVVLCNRTGTAKDGTEFSGGSMVIDPEGNVVALLGSEVGTCSADLDFERVRSFRDKFPVLAMSRRAW